MSSRPCSGSCLPRGPLPRMRARAIRQVPGTLFWRDAAVALAALAQPRGLLCGDEVAAFEEFLQANLGGAHAVTFGSGRASLFAILHALGIGAGDEVIVPGYTCVVVPAAVQAIGARPVYADVTSAGTGPRLDAVQGYMSARTRAVLVQHTYGLPADLEPILALAREQGIAVIEDACHGLGTTYRGSPVGTLGDASFFSTEYSKVLTTGQGGFAVTRDPDLARRLRNLRKAWELPSPKATRAVLSGLVGLYLLHHPRFGRPLTRSVRFRNLVGRLTTSTTLEECRGLFPRIRLRPLANALARIGLEQARRIQLFSACRRAAATTYRSSLRDCDLTLPDIPEESDALYLRFPVWVRDREPLLQSAAAVDIELGVWFEGPLHPAPPNASLLGYRPGTCPVGERLAREAVNLPTHPRLTREDISRVVATVRRATGREDPPC